MTRPGAAANFSLFVRATPDSIVRGLPRGYEIAGEFYDAAVSGTDPIAERPGFKAAIAAFANAGSHRQQRRPVPYVSATNAGPDKDSDKRQRGGVPCWSIRWDSNANANIMRTNCNMRVTVW